MEFNKNSKVRKYFILDNIHIFTIFFSSIVLITFFLIMDKYDVLSNSELSYDFWITFIAMSIPLLITIYIYVLSVELKLLNEVEKKSGINYNTSISSIEQQYYNKVINLYKVGQYSDDAFLFGDKNGKLIYVEQDKKYYIIIYQNYLDDLVIKLAELDDNIIQEIEQYIGLSKFNLCTRLKLNKLLNILELNNSCRGVSVKHTLEMQKFIVTEKDLTALRTLHNIDHTYFSIFDEVVLTNSGFPVVQNKTLYKFEADINSMYHMDLAKFIMEEYWQ